MPLFIYRYVVPNLYDPLPFCWTQRNIFE